MRLCVCGELQHCTLNRIPVSISPSRFKTLPRTRTITAQMSMKRTHFLGAHVAALPPSVTMGMPHGFPSQPTRSSEPWTDHWFKRPEAETTDMVICARPCFVDDGGCRRDFVISHSEVYLIGYGLALGWVQVQNHVPPMTPWDIAFNQLLSRQ